MSAAVELPRFTGPNRFRLAWLPEDFDLATGVILEGWLRARSVEQRHLPPAAGFSLSEKAPTSRVLVLEVGEAGGREASVGRIDAPDGAAFVFSVDDRAGQGCATVTGLDDGKAHAFRLLVRGSTFELYVDDLLVQTQAFRPHGGRIGIVGRNVDLAVGDLKGWALSLPPGPQLSATGQE